MAVVTDAEYSEIAKIIMDQVSQFDCLNETKGKFDILNYLNLLKKQYNATILTKSLTQVIHNVDDMYYNNGTSPWSDFQYDCFVDCLKSSSSFSNELVAKIGIGVGVGADVGMESGGAAVELPYFMASMNKYKNISEIKNWCRKFRPPYTVTAKLDGVSAMFHKGKLYTRGNGICGRDISYLIPFLKNEWGLNMLSQEFGVRGELIIRKSVFEKNYASQFANSRNLVCGLLNRVYCKENEMFYRDIDFIVYDIYHHNPLQFCNKIKIIHKSQCQLVKYMDNVGGEQMNDLKLVDAILKKWKSEYDYEIDGIIITNNKPCIHPSDSNPDFAFAYKNNSIGVEMKEATVDKVVWNVSKDNYLKPKIKLTEKVLCDGSQVEYVTGFNAKYILQNNIKQGTIVKIGLSGNVIPHIFEIVCGNEEQLTKSVWEDLKHPITMGLLENIDCEPGSYNWNKNKVDLVSANKDNHACIIKKNMVFFHSFEIKCGLQETTLMNLYKSLGIYKLSDILSLTVEQWEQVEKVGTKKGENIVSTLKSALEWSDGGGDGGDGDGAKEYFMKWLLGLQCFPRGFGKKKLENHVKYLLQICLSNSQLDFSKMFDADYFKSLETIIVCKVEDFKTPQVTSDSIVLFCSGFHDFIETYNEIKTEVKNIEFPFLRVLLENIVNSGGDDGHGGGVGGGGGSGGSSMGNVVFSGCRDKQKESYYLNQGYEISNSVNSKTKLLIVKDKNAQTTKTKKAVALGVDIVALNDI